MRKFIMAEWALVLWTESSETSIIKLETIKDCVRKSIIKVGWTGYIPWIDECGECTEYKSKILKISSK